MDDLAGAALADFAAIFLEDAEVGVSDTLAFVRGKGPPTLRSCLQALRFLHGRLGLAELFRQLDSPVIKGYALEDGAPPLKQACALPLAAVLEAERLLRSQDECLGVRLFCGALLCGIWASLRFGDLVTIDPASLSLHDGVLRGYCSLTKSRKRGMPFACLGRGLLASAPDDSWAVIFLIPASD